MKVSNRVASRKEFRPTEQDLSEISILQNTYLPYNNREKEKIHSSTGVRPAGLNSFLVATLFETFICGRFQDYRQ